jgi:autotransporter family porin
MTRHLTLYVFAMAFTTSAAQAAYVASGEVIPADPTVWTNSTPGYIGKTSAGVLTVDGGSPLLSQSGCLGFAVSSSGSATVDGSNTAWTNQNELIVGNYGSGTLQITNGGRVADDYGYQGYYPGSTGTVTVDGAGSNWTNRNYLYMGLLGPGVLNVTRGGSVADAYAYLGYYSGGTGSATVDGADSNWTNSGGLYVGAVGTGTLDVTNGGRVDNAYGYLGYDPGSHGTVVVDGPDSRWTCNGSLYVGVSGTGSVAQSGGTVSIDGALCLGDTSTGNGAYDLNGGTLILKSLAKGSGTAAFRFGGGTLQASGNFTCSLPVTLTGEGGDANVHTNGYDVVLSGALSGSGGLNKLGDGSLTLGALETYAGDTTVSGGTLNFTGGIDAGGATLIDVQSGKAVLSTTDIVKNDLDIVAAAGATFQVTSGTHVLGEISGGGTTQVDTGASLTVASITQSTLTIGATSPPGAAPVPEPGFGILLITACLAIMVYVKRR